MGAEYHHRGYLRHIDGVGLTQAVTFRLDGSLPQEVYKLIAADAQELPEFDRRSAISRAVDRHLDKGEGPTWLQQAPVASLVEASLLRFNRERYLLHAWVVMPNHVHVLLTLLATFRLRSVLQGVKGNSARKANRILERSGRFWQPGYFDRVVRDEAHFRRFVWYIHQNPVRSGQVEEAEQYRWSSARFRPTFARCMRAEWEEAASGVSGE